jgi:hypothetical protein
LNYPDRVVICPEGLWVERGANVRFAGAGGIYFLPGFGVGLVLVRLTILYDPCLQGQ